MLRAGISQESASPSGAHGHIYPNKEAVMLNPNPSPHSDPDTLTRFHEELTRASGMLGVEPAGPALWPGFAGLLPRTRNITNLTEIQVKTFIVSRVGMG